MFEAIEKTKREIQAIATQTKQHVQLIVSLLSHGEVVNKCFNCITNQHIIISTLFIDYFNLGIINIYSGDINIHVHCVQR